MEKVKKYNSATLTIEIATILLAILFLVPFYFLIVNSLKSAGEITANAAALPSSFQWENYSKAFEKTNFLKTLWNSLYITVLSNAGLVVICSMAAYRMVRHSSKLNNIFFFLLVASMVAPFQAIMIPLVRVAKTLGLMGTQNGLILCYWGFGAAISIVLYHGFMKSIPKEVEESAVVDGCTPYGVFWKIVFPLLKPMTVTIIILNSLWIWNDFLLPQLIMNKAADRTIPLMISAFFGQYTKQWDLAMPALILGITPIIIFFLAMQKHIVEGITSGAVKG